MTNKQIPSCKRFSGYKPCFTDYDCWTNGCKDNVPIGKKILIINLDAMGDVLMTTAQLPALKKKFPESTIYWVTLKIAAPLLYNNQFIDKVYSFDAESILVLDTSIFINSMTSIFGRREYFIGESSGCTHLPCTHARKHSKK